MSRGAFIALLLICLNGCAVRLKQASEPWDKPKPNAMRLAKSWGPAQTGGRPVQVQQRPDAVADAKWQVRPPGLPNQANQPNQAVQAKQTVPAGSVVEIARQFLGTPYVYGGETPKEGFDCSGLVQYVYAQKGIPMRRLANEQFLQGSPVPKNELQPGDLVFFSTSGKIVDHVGIYAGDRLFIHAPRTGRSVSYDSLDSAWYNNRFQGARRIGG